MNSRPLFAGVELGGTKCVAILAAGAEPVIERETVPTTTPEATLGAIGELLDRWRSERGYSALGIASFGPVDIDAGSATYGSITTTPKPGWRDTSVLRPLQRIANVPTAFDTDVNGAALAEMRWGAGQGFDDFAYITVGTGVGVGLIVNGRPTRGFAHCELGHIRVARLPGDAFGGSCPYHGDCVEGLAAGPSLTARVGDALSELPSDDPVWESVSSAIAQLCHAIVCAAAPRAIAIGGGVIEKQPHLLDRVEKMLVDSLNGYMQLPTERRYIRPPALGSNAGPLGAIALAMTALQ
ncbi:MAG TPA: ROK family protein [Sphingomicrobium sp.]|nr:ROK family protein [Sphingomicrobium sp.]